MNNKVIVFNGPPGSGKDTAVDIIWMDFMTAEHRRFKDRLFEITCAIYGVPQYEFTGEMYTRENKEKPYEVLGGLSPRQALIKVSEEVIKPAFGDDYFGKALADSIEDNEVTLVSDSGFLEELIPVVERVGAANVLVVKILRAGYGYNGDSRGYLNKVALDLIGVTCIDIYNNNSITDFERKVEKVVGDFMGEVL